MKITKKNWMQIHTYLSLFFLPLAIIYAMTGGLFMFGVNHHSTATTYEFTLDSMPRKGEESKAIIDTLLANNLRVPKDTTIKINRGSASMGNVAYSASISKDKDGNPIVRVTDRSLYSILMMMHKSAGTKHDVLGFKMSFFDMMAVAFSLSLLLFYLSGLIVTSFCKRDRKVAFSFLGVGFIITILAVYFSI